MNIKDMIVQEYIFEEIVKSIASRKNREILEYDILY